MGPLFCELLMWIFPKFAIIRVPTSGLLQYGIPDEYLEGQGDLVSRLITPITRIVTLVIPI